MPILTHADRLVSDSLNSCEDFVEDLRCVKRAIEAAVVGGNLTGDETWREVSEKICLRSWCPLVDPDRFRRAYDVLREISRMSQETDGYGVYEH
jgi:hypothetical protein